MYITSAILFLPFKACTVYNLRLTSLIASAINVYLIFGIRNKHEPKRHAYSAYTALETLTISLLPPMFFFSNLYYTDILSITTVLALTYFSSNDRHTVASLCGGLSFLMRQTNIIWVGMFFAYSALNSVMVHTLLTTGPKKLPHHIALHYHLGVSFVV